MDMITLGKSLDKVAFQEVVIKGKKFFKAQFNPFTSKGKKDKLYNELLESLTDDTFRQLAPVLVMQLEFSKDRAEQFENSGLQADAYIKRRPRMEAFRHLIVERMKEFRRKCELSV